MNKKEPTTIDYRTANDQLNAKKEWYNELLKSMGTDSKKRLERNTIVLVSAVKVPADGVKKEKKEVEQAKHLTVSEIKELTKATAKGLSALVGLPSPPYEIIIPAPAFGNLSAAKLCNKVAPWFITIAAIPAFSTTNPTVASSQLIYQALFPLSSIGRKISDSDLATRKILTKQLRDNVSATLKSCAILANGNMALFLLIGAPAKRKSTRSNKPLPACEFKLNLKKGRGKVGITSKKIEGAKGFTVWFGENDFDRTTWQSQSGGPSQIIIATPGIYLNFVMIAYKGDGTEGNVANIQGCNVPFS